MKTLNRNIDNRGELRNRHGKYIDGHDRGLMKKHLEEDRKKMIMERDEQLIRATQEKRAWDAMDPGEKETRLAKKARNKFLVGRLGAGVGSHKDTYETDEIPVWQPHINYASRTAINMRCNDIGHLHQESPRWNHCSLERN